VPMTEYKVTELKAPLISPIADKGMM